MSKQVINEKKSNFMIGYFSKKQREIIKQKFDGLCGYSGTLLEDDWQIDHIRPIIRNKFDGTAMFPCVNYYDNLIPCQRIINHYKGSLSLEAFRNRILTLHKRIDKPKNPKNEKSKRKKEYLNKVAAYFKITPTKPFDGIFYFERIEKKSINFNDKKQG